MFHVTSIHRMPDEDAFVQVLLLDELFHILCHNLVVVLFRVKRVAMIPEILEHVSHTYWSEEDQVMTSTSNPPE